MASARTRLAALGVLALVVALVWGLRLDGGKEDGLHPSPMPVAQVLAPVNPLVPPSPVLGAFSVVALIPRPVLPLLTAVAVLQSVAELTLKLAPWIKSSVRVMMSLSKWL